MLVGAISVAIAVPLTLRNQDDEDPNLAEANRILEVEPIFDGSVVFFYLSNLTNKVSRQLEIVWKKVT